MALTPDRWIPLEPRAAGRVVLPGKGSTRVGTVSRSDDYGAEDAGSMSAGSTIGRGDDSVPMNFRLSLQTNAVGARKNANPRKREQFEDSVVHDLAQLLGVGEERLVITIDHSDDGDDDVAME